ncbi:MAG: hypothetical protein AUH08_03110 [Verrucomicrobia bacterium 13_2_20CM_54_12]|nr:MAG: hypothetical protein AUH08_03110 [Verrucomicrobia bacterium 13_2_20CM_54_12]OLD71298.1 MAG: hypothetical protein AUF68_10415 [Verrucomicrobia bacterium 13_1_20CM_54_28]
MGNRDRIYRIASINKEEASRNRALDRQAYRGRSFDFKAVRNGAQASSCGADRQDARRPHSQDGD